MSTVAQSVLSFRISCKLAPGQLDSQPSGLLANWASASKAPDRALSQRFVAPGTRRFEVDLIHKQRKRLAPPSHAKTLPLRSNHIARLMGVGLTVLLYAGVVPGVPLFHLRPHHMGAPAAGDRPSSMVMHSTLHVLRISPDIIRVQL